ncbi:hypothetical protein OAE19_05290 [Porticoccaceae bacterium]|nr:hypothetical protein [Porticoccaceae bacterium]
MSDFTQADLDALNKAIKTGVTEVIYRDRTVKYRTLQEMLSLRAIIKTDLNPPVVASDRAIRTTFDKAYQ